MTFVLSPILIDNLSCLLPSAAGCLIFKAFSYYQLIMSHNGWHILVCYLEFFHCQYVLIYPQTNQPTNKILFAATFNIHQTQKSTHHSR